MLSPFHPIVAAWFESRFGEPTDAQRLGWPEIMADRHTLIAAPTGSGKTLAAFLVCIDRLLRQAIDGKLTEETQVVYVSPLKALSNDIHRNLETPLAQISEAARGAGHALPELRVMVRTGDTPASARQSMVRRPPHIVVTTPESLYLLLTSGKGREMLRTVRTVIVDEIHALARDKRGSHLSLSLERLAALCPQPLTRIGLSATQRPIEEIGRFLVGNQESTGGAPACSIVDAGHLRSLDLAIEVPQAELSAVCSHETWDEIYERLAELIRGHRSTLIFVNTRRLAERVSYRLRELLGEEAVASHHGSLSKEIRLLAEKRLQSGQLKAIVATASLELGIDVGYIDLVCQIGSPRSIATFLQRVGRAGHSIGRVPCGRLFPLTRDELLECLAVIRAVRGRRLDQIEIPQAPLDILAQQMVATVSGGEWSEDDLYRLCRGAWPYRNLSRADFDAVVEMLSEGVSRRTRQGAYLHRDQVHGRLRARRAARLAALTSGGAIPETADYRVVTREDRTFVGTLNEDFAIESIRGDVFLLGNTSWRVVHVRGGEVVVEDAHAAPANVPFWLGEAPGRTVELSAEVSALREELAKRAGGAENELPRTRGDLKLEDGLPRPSQHEGDGLGRPSSELAPRMAANWSSRQDTLQWLQTECGASPWAAEQVLRYVESQVTALGLVPTQREIVFERFFDDSGGMQLVIHAPFGARINRAWGLAFRKRFCRSFDFELQASADDNGIVLSLGPQHSFPIDQMFRMLNRQNAQALLVQALLAVPMFQIRWRWNATRALAILRQRGGKKVPPPLQRFHADDLLTAVFPAQTACQENVVGDIEVPNHPLVNQTVYDCLHEAMDIDGWLELLGRLENGQTQIIGKDTYEPSPFSHEILNANVYAFLDDAPLEERRARAVATRRTTDRENWDDLARLDPEAIERVAREAWPLVRDADELHDCLLSHAAWPAAEGQPWAGWFAALVEAGRATRLVVPDGPELWVAAERLSLVHAAFPAATIEPKLELPEAMRGTHESAAGAVELVRGQTACRGPLTAMRIAELLGLRVEMVSAALEALEGEGAVLRGRFTPGARETQWCDRRLLARIHRLTLTTAREKVQPVSASDFWRFLLAHQHLLPSQNLSSRFGLREILGQLQGFEAPAGAWERDVLPGRLADYDPAWLDELSLGGEVAWGRLQPPRRWLQQRPSSGSLHRAVPIALASRANLEWLLPPDRAAGPAVQHAGATADSVSLESPTYSGNAQAVLEALTHRGALFLHDLASATDLLPSQLEEALGELAALGLVTADGFAAIRAIVSPKRGAGARPRRPNRGRAPAAARPGGGRWSRFPGWLPQVDPAERVEHWAQLLLWRYGVIFRDLLARETVAPAWGELARIYRRWEAQGRVCGGRFVSGVAGEQFAMPEAIEDLRRVREAGPSGQWIVVSAADPLNLAGILAPGPRVPAKTRNALALLDGRVVAVHQSGQTRFLENLASDLADAIGRALRVTTVVRRLHAAGVYAGLTPRPATPRARPQKKATSPSG
ncbi:MAG TPA: DEAD/DEAH box helicase [Pirellulales bacterium]|nr:DEAD/DEAH box helicase [Pirellulales bacterium]